MGLNISVIGHDLALSTSERLARSALARRLRINILRQKKAEGSRFRGAGKSVFFHELCFASLYQVWLCYYGVVICLGVLEGAQPVDDFVCFVSTDSESDEDNDGPGVRRVHRTRRHPHLDVSRGETFAPIGLDRNGKLTFCFKNTFPNCQTFVTRD